MISSPLTIVQRRRRRPGRATGSGHCEGSRPARRRAPDRTVRPGGTAGGRRAAIRGGAGGRGRDEIRVVFWDERLTTAVAERTLQESGPRRGGKGDVDAVAAAVILQGYLDACRARGLRGEKTKWPMRGSMCFPARGHRRHAGDEIRGALRSGKMLEETDSATNVGCRQFRKARANEEAGHCGNPERGRGHGRRCAARGGFPDDPARQHGWVPAARQHHAHDRGG